MDLAHEVTNDEFHGPFIGKYADLCVIADYKSVLTELSYELLNKEYQEDFESPELDVHELVQEYVDKGIQDLKNASSSSTFLYIALSPDLDINYIGITKELDKRFSDHRRYSKWTGDSSYLVAFEYPERNRCELVEKYLISKYMPSYNKIRYQLNGRPEPEANIQIYSNAYLYQIRSQRLARKSGLGYLDIENFISSKGEINKAIEVNHEPLNKQ